MDLSPWVDNMLCIRAAPNIHLQQFGRANIVLWGNMFLTFTASRSTCLLPMHSLNGYCFSISFIMFPHELQKCAVYFDLPFHKSGGKCVCVGRGVEISDAMSINVPFLVIFFPTYKNRSSFVRIVVNQGYYSEWDDITMLHSQSDLTMGASALPV